jgi:hypothetical protein
MTEINSGDITSTPANYTEYIAMIRAKFNAFFLEAENGRITNTAAMRSRRLSFELREDLKNFRLLSLLQGKENQKRKDAKKCLRLQEQQQ